MRRSWLCAPMILLLLTSCAVQTDAAEARALEMRTAYVAMQTCAGSVAMTADYGQRVYTYEMDFTAARDGETVLQITAPENIAGITARLGKDKTALEYDGARVETGPLSPDGMSPVDALPALLHYADAGFIAACALETEDARAVLHVTCRAPEASPGTGAEAQLYFDAETYALRRGELAQDGVTVIQCVFSSFEMD